MILRTLKIILLIYIGFGLVLFFGQRSFMYFPVAESSPGNASYEYLQSDAESIKVWILRPGKNKAVIYFGGNAEDVSGAIAGFNNSLPDHSVYLVNYRGYGGSSGDPTEENLFADALNIYAVLQQRHAQIDIIGRSLGSGIATYVASQRPVSRLVLVTPYDSVLAIAQHKYPIYPVAVMLQDKFESIEYATQIRTPTLIIAAEHDDLIPAENTDRLAQAFITTPVERFLIKNAGHNDLTMHQEYWRAIDAFLDSDCVRAC